MRFLRFPKRLSHCGQGYSPSSGRLGVPLPLRGVNGEVSPLSLRMSGTYTISIREARGNKLGIAQNCGSGPGPVFRIQIRIHSGKNMIKWREKVKTEDKKFTILRLN